MPKKQKSGLYRARIKIGVKPDGSDLYKYISGKTQKELEDERRRVLAYFVDGEQRPEDCQFGICAQKWFEKLQQATVNEQRSISTLESYRTALNKDILPVFGSRNMRAIRAAELQDFVDQYAGMSRTKITYISAALGGVFNFACTSGLLDKNPIDHIEKPSAKAVAEKRALTSDERARIIAVSHTHEYGAYLACMFYLGARPGEVRGLQWGDFDWERGLVHIQRDIDYKKAGEDKVGKLKNAKSNRYVPIPSDLKFILAPLRAASQRFLFEGIRSGDCIAKTSAERMWVDLMLACNMVVKLPDGANGYRESDIRSKYKPIITPHTMRHNYVTMCWEKGIDVYTASKLVGHKSIKTTMDIYTHLSDKQMDKAINDVENMFRAD